MLNNVNGQEVTFLIYTKPQLSELECSKIINGGGPNISESMDGGGLYS